MTTTTLDPDGLLPVTNIPLGSITAQAEYLTTQHPGELTIEEFHALPERYYEKIVRSRCESQRRLRGTETRHVK